jgi:hypothetical protein
MTMKTEFEVIESDIGAIAGKLVDTASSSEEAIEKAKAKKVGHPDREFFVQDQAGNFIYSSDSVQRVTLKLATENATPSTAASTMVVLGGFPIIPESNREKLEKWLFKPLAEMRGSQGFLVLMVLLPLYERCLRQIKNIPRNENFSDKHRVFDEIASDLGITKDEAQRFWRGVRNMLMHWGGEEDTTPALYNWGIEESGPMIQFEKDSFRLNPFALRDKLIPKILNNADSWTKESAFLQVTYRRDK